jgi:hypothetical protein
MDHEFIWLPRGEKVPERDRHMTQSNKSMIAAVWNLRRLQLVGAEWDESGASSSVFT